MIRLIYDRDRINRDLELTRLKFKELGHDADKLLSEMQAVRKRIDSLEAQLERRATQRSP